MAVERATPLSRAVLVVVVLLVQRSAGGRPGRDSSHPLSLSTEQWTGSPVSRSDSEVANSRNVRQTSGGADLVCPDNTFTEHSCPLGCKKTRQLCTVYSSMFAPVVSARTSGQTTWTGVSRDTCATRCALLAPACRHFSFKENGGHCIVGCRKGSSKCKESGKLTQDSSWTFYFASAKKLAALAGEVVSLLGVDAGMDSKVVRNISAKLKDRFGEPEDAAGRAAIAELFASSGAPSPAADGGTIASMISNSRDDLLPADCGRVPLQDLIALIPLIAHGEPAAPGQYPWQARILVTSGGSLSHRCGGIIITNRHILTAAHCLRNVAINLVEVSVGEVNLDEPSEFRERFALENMLFHENYTKGGQHRNDIMLLRLQPKRRRHEPNAPPYGVLFNEYVQPACLPRAGLVYDTETPLVCKISGWGSTAAQSTATTNELRGVEVPLVSDRYCGSNEAYGRLFYRDVMFCAGYTNGGPDSCGGDSGGPLACPLLDSGRYAAYGIVSHSHPNGCGAEPSVYTRVEHYEDWIINAIRKLG